MSILALLRNFNGDPNIVTMVTDNTVAQITTSGYFTSDDSVAEVEALNNGAFETADTDLWLIYASDGISFYTYNSSTGAFVANPPASGISSTLPDGEILVGSALNVATPVAMSGDATIDNAGVLTIAAGAIDNAKVDAAAAIAFSKLAALPSAQILVGSAGNVATAVAMTGDVAIDNAGATTIQAGAIDLAMLSAGIAPSHVVKFGGQHTTVGGAAAEAITVTGAAATDLAFVQLVDPGTNTVSVVQAVVTLDTLTVTFSGNPGNDAVVNYQLLRVAS